MTASRTTASGVQGGPAEWRLGITPTLPWLFPEKPFSLRMPREDNRQGDFYALIDRSMLWIGAGGGGILAERSGFRHRNPARRAGRPGERGDAGVLERPLLPLAGFLPSQIPREPLAVPPVPRVSRLLPLTQRPRLARTASEPRPAAGLFPGRHGGQTRSRLRCPADIRHYVLQGIVKVSSLSYMRS